jgi:DNA repair protein RadC
MKNLSHEGHRERLREQYLKASAEAMPDHHLLELILCYAIPRRDVKDISYALINRFGSFENVINAPIEELEEVEGIGKSAAILINMFRTVPAKIDGEICTKTKYLSNFEEAKTYVSRLLQRLDKEKVIAITLGSSLEILGCHTISVGTRASSSFEPKEIVSKALKDDAVSVILAHNHPGGSYLPSEADEKITLVIRDLLAPLGIQLADHIIVGFNGVLSMNNDVRYTHIFNSGIRPDK